MFTHLHVHSHYSILDGMSKVPALVKKAASMGMNAIALTDHGNMFGIKEFTDEVKKYNSNPDNPHFKAIIGVEAYCARRTLYDKDPNYRIFDEERKKDVALDRSGWHLILLAKNKTGYQNLCKIVTKGWVDGFYDRPRIDKNILKEHKDGLIVCSACLGGELPYYILRNQTEEAEKSARWFKEVFGDDYYIELQRHETSKESGGDTTTYDKQCVVNPVLVDIAHKLGIKIIASNDVHFIEEKHAEAHERLICISTGAKLEDENRMRYTKQEWLKSGDEMAKIFSDLPEAIENTQEIVDKVEEYSIESDPIMPMFDIPKEFGTVEEYKKRFTEEDLFNEFTRNEKGEVVLSDEDAKKKIKKLGGYEKLYRIKLEADYLAKLAWEGAEKRYGKDMDDHIKENIIFELHIMKTMGFPGYFLIVQDYIKAAREQLGVSVGPGRGSAAGSVVAYCLTITDVDPLKYNLLFERFLNPDRISLPDIDVDFDDDGRGLVLDWITKKYGKERVAHIITYGTMATKSSMKDVGRMQNVPLSDMNRLVGYVPNKFPEDPKTGKSPEVSVANCVKMVPELQQARNGEDENIRQTLEYAEQLEGTIRQIGIHACGVIIGADDLTKFAPLSTVKDKNTGEDVMVTEYDGHVVESVGLIKMDFLGLSTLSIIKEALSNIKTVRNIDVDIDHIPIDDEKTFKLYSDGSTVGTFQFESAGMQKYLRELQPTVFEDLIAMNALYRPGPMEYIPDFIDRKHGRKPIEYDIPVMEKYLKDTYGVTVYQEQVMQLSRLLAGFTRGQSDTLRKAMGKKQRKVLDELKPKFINGGVANGHDTAKLEKIWSDWEAFAKYAFNKSHATCYAWVSYQTAYLKANYPAEFMAANLTRNKDDITEVTKFMSECKAMGINVLGPDVNESRLHFIPNDKGDIRFGLGGIKGVGDIAVEAIIKARDKGGKFKDIYDFFERVNLAACNKKAIESLVYGGAFDNIGGITREQFFATNKKGLTTIEVLMRYGNTYQTSKLSMQNSLFGDMGVEIQKPVIEPVAPWDNLFKLRNEKDVVGMYISAHPLDKYKVLLQAMNVTNLTEIQNNEEFLSKYAPGTKLNFGGIVTFTEEKIGMKSGKPYIVMEVEDFSGNHSFSIAGKLFPQYRNVFLANSFVLISGEIKERYQRKEDKEAGKPVEYSFSINTIESLDDVKNRYKFDLNITLPLDNVRTDVIETLGNAMTDIPDTDGLKADLYVNVYDKEAHTEVNFKRKQEVYVNNKLIDVLSAYNLIKEGSGFNDTAMNGDDIESYSQPEAEEQVLTYYFDAKPL